MVMGRGKMQAGLGVGLIMAVSIAVSAQINLRGKVVTASGAPLANVTVELIGFRQIVKTDANGIYMFSGTPVLPRPALGSAPSIQNGRLFFSLPDRAQSVRLTLFNAAGKKHLVLESDRLAGGRHSVDLNSRLSGIPFTGARFFQLRIGEQRYVFKDFHTGGTGAMGQGFLPAQEARSLYKVGAAPDSLPFNLEGYED
jgi:hypothetical protein